MPCASFADWQQFLENVLDGRRSQVHPTDLNLSRKAVSIVGHMRWAAN